MSVTVRIPTPLRNLTDGAETVEGSGATVGEVIADICASHQGLRDRLYDDGGAIRRFVNVFLNNEDIRFEQGPDTAVKDGDELSIIPAIAGG
ncbi:MAG: MoaD/ThiS family protein [Phycisphaerae bacterium]|nr:MoaD/ThiS family protein [Phycisphaerae bacterium]